MLRELLLNSVRKQKRNVIKLFLALGFLALSQVLFLFLIGPFLKALFLAKNPDQLISLRDLFSEKMVHLVPESLNFAFPSSEIKIYLPLMLFLAGTLRAVAKYIYQYNHEALALFVAKDYREKLFGTILQMPFIDINKRTPGEWMSTIMNDVYYLQSRFSDFVSTFLRDGILIFSCLLALAYMHWPTALVLFILCPFVAKWLGSIGKRISFFAELWQKEMSNLTAHLLEVRARFNLIRAEKAEQFELKRFSEINNNYYKNIRKSLWVRSMFAPSLEFWGFVVFAAFVFAFGRGYLSQSISPDILIQFLAALGLLLRPLKNFGEELTRFNETRGALQESFKLLQTQKTQPAVSSSPKRSPLPQILHIENLESGYLSDIKFRAQNLRFEKGKSYAVIGPSGSGKTTFLRTLAGILEPLRWQASIDFPSLRSQASFVSQQPFLFDDTLRNNLMYGQKGAGDNGIRDKLKTVNLMSDIEQLSDGLEARVKAIQGNFSGGQIQRLVIARSLMKEAGIWLLDEATSAIDAKTEKDIIERLTAACRKENKILIAITHRLQWLPLFDEILFVENGEIRAAGNHIALQKNHRFLAFSAAPT